MGRSHMLRTLGSRKEDHDSKGIRQIRYADRGLRCRWLNLTPKRAAHQIDPQLQAQCSNPSSPPMQSRSPDITPPPKPRNFKHKKRPDLLPSLVSLEGAKRRTRTADTSLFRAVLYLLSYLRICGTTLRCVPVGVGFYGLAPNLSISFSSHPRFSFHTTHYPAAITSYSTTYHQSIARTCTAHHPNATLTTLALNKPHDSLHPYDDPYDYPKTRSYPPSPSPLHRSL